MMRLAVRGEKGKFAVSEIEYSLCRSDSDRIVRYAGNALINHPVAYAIDKVIAKMGGPSESQVVDIDRRDEQYKFIPRMTALQLLSETAQDLLKNPRFVEPGTGQPADWAQKIYEFFLAEQSKNPESVR